jgi:hypothetical protein
MQITSQQYPEHRMRLPQDSRSGKKDYSGELLISCLNLSRVGYFCPDVLFSLVDNRPKDYGGVVSRPRVDLRTEVLAEAERDNPPPWLVPPATTRKPRHHGVASGRGQEADQRAPREGLGD